MLDCTVHYRNCFVHSRVPYPTVQHQFIPCIPYRPVWVRTVPYPYRAVPTTSTHLQLNLDVVGWNHHHRLAHSRERSSQETRQNILAPCSFQCIFCSAATADAAVAAVTATVPPLSVYVIAETISGQRLPRARDGKRVRFIVIPVCADMRGTGRPRGNESVCMRVCAR